MPSGLSIARKSRILNGGGKGSSSNLGRIAIVASQLSAEISPAVLQATEEAALVSTRAIRKEIAKDTGGDSRMSGVRGSGRVGAKYTVLAQRSTRPSAVIQAIGPLQLLEAPTKAHPILPRGIGRVQGRRTKANRRAARQNLYDALFGSGSGFAGAKPLRTPYGPRFRVSHPGTRGKKTWTRGRERAEKLSKDVYAEALVKVVRKGAR